MVRHPNSHSSRPRTTSRRGFLRASAAATAALALNLGTACSASAENAVELSAEHLRAVNRRRRIVVQYDCQDCFGMDFASWLSYRFRYADEPGTQIDSIWWDMGRLGQVLYPSRLFDRLEDAGLRKWRDQGIDLVGRLVDETRKRGLEVFWHHRVSEVDTQRPDPLKKAHPDWALKTKWWRYGLWDFSVPAVRQSTVHCLREVAEMYNFDGIQIDFARHVPCLPPGHQWELRHHVTELMRAARQMLQEVATKRGRPYLLAAKVPQTLEGCRIDGLDVETWAREGLVDIFTLGSRSADVDVAAFRRITESHPIKLQPCFDDHHATDGYRYAPIEVLRGVFADWWQQGADSVATFNWSNAPPEACQALGIPPGPPCCHRQAYHELGSLETMRFKNKTFIVERRGGYPWAEGFFNRNDTAPLPLKVAPGSTPARLRVRISDDLSHNADRIKTAVLRLILFGAADDANVEVSMNDVVLPLAVRDPQWKDPQIFSPRPQPASGGAGDYKIDPRQRLLRLDFTINPKQCRIGENRVAVRLAGQPGEPRNSEPAIEKLEVHVRYTTDRTIMK
jgi:hypothetical protein